MKSGYTLEAFQTRVIDAGIAAARADYFGDGPLQTAKREGSVEGFEACRLKTPAELALLLRAAEERVEESFLELPAAYWRVRARALEIRWVCNCVSAVLMNEGRPTILAPTMRAVLWAAEILGVGV